MRLQAADKIRLVFVQQILFDDSHITIHQNLLGGVRDQNFVTNLCVLHKEGIKRQTDLRFRPPEGTGHTCTLFIKEI
jgi:hypothetical protein